MNTRTTTFLGLAILLLGWGCKREAPLEKIDHIDFLRFYHVADEAVGMVESDGGYTILANGNKSDDHSFLKLIKVDREGHLLWRTVLGEKEMSWKGHDLILTEDGGYAVSGEYFDEWEVGYAKLIRFLSNGDLLWTAGNPRTDSIRGLAGDGEVVQRLGRGKSIVELNDGRFAMLVNETHIDSGKVLLCELYSANGSLESSNWRVFDFEASAGGMSLSGDSLLILAESERLDPTLGASDLILFKIGMHDLVSGFDIGRDLVEVFYRLTEKGRDFAEIGRNVVQGEGANFLLGTTISPGDLKPHIYVIKLIGSEVAWEYLDRENEENFGSIGLGMASLPGGGALVVGESIEKGKKNFVLCELAPARIGVDAEDRGIGGLERRFTFGSDLDPESAKAVLVTREGKWLILGDNSFQGQLGIWLMQIDPEKLD